MGNMTTSDIIATTVVKPAQNLSHKAAQLFATCNSAWLYINFKVGVKTPPLLQVIFLE